MITGKTKKAAAADRTPAIATGVRFGQGRFTVTLADGRELAIPLSFYPTLAKATAAQRNRWDLLNGGRAISWDALDLDLSVQFLIEGAKEGIPKPPGAASRQKKSARGDVPWRVTSPRVQGAPE